MQHNPQQEMNRIDNTNSKSALIKQFKQWMMELQQSNDNDSETTSRKAPGNLQKAGGCKFHCAVCL